MDITTIICLIIFLAALAYSTIFKVKDVHLGLPSSIFSGRLKKKTDKKSDFSLPLCKPYKEGLHLKLPWWTIKEISREVETKKIEKREYPVGSKKAIKDGCGADSKNDATKKGKGGTVQVSGMIQYRPSSIALYRYEEVNKEAIDEGLDSELEQIIRGSLAESDAEEAINKVYEVSTALWDRLAGFIITPIEQTVSEKGLVSDGGIKNKARKLFKKDVSYAEHSYGIEVLKAKIDTIEVTDDLKDARDAKQKEEYEKDSETIEWNHMRERATELKKDFPKLSDEQVWDAIQLWQEQSTKHTNKIDVKGADALVGIAAEFLKGRKK